MKKEKASICLPIWTFILNGCKPIQYPPRIMTRALTGYFAMVVQNITLITKDLERRKCLQRSGKLSPAKFLLVRRPSPMP